MNPNRISITDEQRKAHGIAHPSDGNICVLGDTKCIDGNTYVCQIGDEMKPDWFFTTELCDGLRSEVFGSVVVTTESKLLATVLKVAIDVQGTIGEPAPKVYTFPTKSPILDIVGIGLSVLGTAKFSGKGLDMLVIEHWPSGLAGNTYKGKAYCTLILK